MLRWPSWLGRQTHRVYKNTFIRCFKLREIWRSGDRNPLAAFYLKENVAVALEAAGLIIAVALIIQSGIGGITVGLI